MDLHIFIILEYGDEKTMGMSAIEIQEFMDNMIFTNHYVTCFFFFGPIFSGVGFLLLGLALIKWDIESGWLGWFTLA